MKVAQEKAETKGERLELQIKVKPNQHLAFSMIRDSNSRLGLSQFKPIFLSLARVVPDTEGNLRVFE